MPIKGYPRARFEIIDNTNVDEISVNQPTYPKPLAMQIFTSDKGPEKWSIIKDLNDFTERYGDISFARHGQAQLNVAEILRAGGCVLGRRLVKDDLGVAHSIFEMDAVVKMTPKANLASNEGDIRLSTTMGTGANSEVVESATLSYRATSDSTMTSINLTGQEYAKFDKIVEYVVVDPHSHSLQNYFTTMDGNTPVVDTTSYNNMKKNANTILECDRIVPDITSETQNTTIFTAKCPFFSIATIDRNINQNLYYKLSPIYNKNPDIFLYKFELYENTNNGEKVIGSINVSLDPQAMLNGIPYDIESRINTNFSSIRAKIYGDYIIKYVQFLKDHYIIPSTISANEYLKHYDIIGLCNNAGVAKRVATPSSTSTTNECINESLHLYYMPEHYEASKLRKIDYSVLDIDSNSFISITSQFEDQNYGNDKILSFNSDEYIGSTLHALGKDFVTNNNVAHKTNIKDYTGDFDTIIYDTDRYKIDFVCDCGYDIRIKNAIISLAEFRQDFVFLSDLKNINRIEPSNDGRTTFTTKTKSDILGAANEITKSKFVAIYCNTCNIYDPYSKKEISVTLPLLLGPKMVSHINSGVGKPFAGILNNITFNEIIDGSVNIIPRKYNNIDERNEFIEKNINYIAYYDDIPVMDTMYVNQEEYTQMSFLSNIMNVQGIIKELRTKCPKTRYTFMDGDDLKKYLEDTQSIINNYNSFFKSISIKYMADAEYESQNIFYAVLSVQFRNFVQEEYFRIFAIS